MRQLCFEVALREAIAALDFRAGSRSLAPLRFRNLRSHKNRLGTRFVRGKSFRLARQELSPAGRSAQARFDPLRLLPDCTPTSAVGRKAVFAVLSTKLDTCSPGAPRLSVAGTRSGNAVTWTTLLGKGRTRCDASDKHEGRSGQQVPSASGGVNDRLSHGILRSLLSVCFIGLYTDRMTA